MSEALLSPSQAAGIRLSFEFFPPKSEDMAGQLWQTVDALAGWQPDFVSVTYGAGGSTREPTRSTVEHLLRQGRVKTASHLTCVGATKDEVHQVVEEFRRIGVRHFVALRGDPAGGVGTAYRPHPGGYANAAELVAGLRGLGDLEISVSAYPEKHPESPDARADIDMLKRKVDAGANRALTQFFFDNDVFARYLERVRAAGIDIPIVPGIMPIQNLTQLKRFAGACGATIPAAVEARLAAVEDDATARATVAAEIAAEQMAGLTRHGIHDFHIYTMNRAALTELALRRLGLNAAIAKAEGAAA